MNVRITLVPFIAACLAACGGVEEAGLEASEAEVLALPACSDAGDSVDAFPWIDTLAAPTNQEAYTQIVCAEGTWGVERAQQHFTTIGLTDYRVGYLATAQASLDAGGAVHAAFTLMLEAWSMNDADGAFRGVVVLRDANGPICQHVVEGRASNAHVSAMDTMYVPLPVGTDLSTLELGLAGRAAVTCGGATTFDQAHARLKVEGLPRVIF